MNWNVAYALEEEYRSGICTIHDIEESGYKIISATVPGNFELDLIRAGELEDLYFSTNTLEAQKMEAMHVWYYTTLHIHDKNQYLHFAGIDTFADIYVNGELIETTDNMFLPYDITADWVIGENEVVVHIKPTMLEARKFVASAACNAQKYTTPSLYVRKAAHMFGWDIMPRIVSAGLWKEVSVCEKKRDKINEVYFATNRIDLEKKAAKVRLYINTTMSGQYATDYVVRVEGHCGNSTFTREEKMWHNTYALGLQIDDCKFWWPKNYGEPNLYTVKISLLYKGEIVDTHQLKIGIRTAELIRTEIIDENDEGDFIFRINGRKVFVLGTNWVPLDAFHSRDRQRLDRALCLLDDTGCNMVRCWGGNVYEDDAFFEFCDEHGIMVWQDFAMGCSVYPQDKVFIDAIEKEAIYLVKRLRNHPALVVWAGDNENDLACYNWNGFERNPNHNIITRDVLPAVIRMHDYTRAYLPSSPYMSEDAYQKKGNMPEKHLWGPRDYFKGVYYKDAVCRFASEIGYHGFPSTASLKKFLKNPDVIFRDDGIATDEYLVHAASMETAENAPFAYRIRLAVDQVETLFGHKESKFSDFIKQSQISQAEADKFFIENFRVKKWKRTGIIWWNLLDGWPQISDAVVDYYFTKKLAYHFIKRSQAPVCLIMGEPVDSVLTLYGVNDLPENVEVFYSVKKVIPGNGFETIREGYAELTGETSSEIGRLSCKPDVQTFYLIEWEIGDKKYKNHYFTNLLNIEYQAYYESLKMCGMDQFEGMDD